MMPWEILLMNLIQTVVQQRMSMTIAIRSSRKQIPMETVKNTNMMEMETLLNISTSLEAKQLQYMIKITTLSKLKREI